MVTDKNIKINGFNGKPIYLDVFTEQLQQLPVIIYAHGFNGFKDWANFDLIAKQFASAGFVFVKFNFSHNGTSGEQPEEFVDLKAYSENNYTIELDDLDAVIDWVYNRNHKYSGNINPERLYLAGHSLGGGIVLLKASEDNRVKKVVTWAAVSECQTPWTNWPSERLEAWRQSGVEYSINSRTKQNLPMKYQLYENFQANQQRLDIRKAIESLTIPILLCHGTNDEAVPFEKAKHLQSWQPKAELFTVVSDHVFGRKHPWPFNYLPEPMQAVVDKTIGFFKK